MPSEYCIAAGNPGAACGGAGTRNGGAEAGRGGPGTAVCRVGGGAGGSGSGSGCAGGAPVGGVAGFGRDAADASGGRGAAECSLGCGADRAPSRGGMKTIATGEDSIDSGGDFGRGATSSASNNARCSASEIRSAWPGTWRRRLDGSRASQRARSVAAGGMMARS
jgi:hypothetical protein